MSEPKFTEGPWVAEDDDGETIVTSDRRQREGRVGICNIDTGFNKPFETEQQANLSLILYAPELYELVDGYLTVLLGKSFSDELRPSEKHFIESGKRLLAKVRGEN